MNMIKAIETHYKGYRFRSRLEARWAVFFDALGLRWEYEPEGFELPSGRYLPDFWLPIQDGVIDQLGCGHWVEIKPVEPTDAALAKLHELVLQTGHTGKLFAGTPGEHVLFEVQRAAPRAPNGSVRVIRPSDRGQSTLPNFSSGEYYSLRTDSPLAGLLLGVTADEARGKAALADAITAARSARFEFGESGAPVTRDYLDDFDALARAGRQA